MYRPQSHPSRVDVARGPRRCFEVVRSPSAGRMAGGTCHIHDNYTTIYSFDGCIVLTNQNNGNYTTLQLYDYHPSNACIVPSVRVEVP